MVDDPRVLADRARILPLRSGDLREAFARRHICRILRGRARVCGLRAIDAAAVEPQLAELIVGPRRVRRRGRGLKGEVHVCDRTRDVPLQLARIRGARIRRKVGSDVDHALEGRESLGVAAELDERVAFHAVRRRVVRGRFHTLLRPAQRTGEVVPCRGERAHADQRSRVAGLQLERTLERALSFRVERRIAGTPRGLHVERPKRCPRAPISRYGCETRLQRRHDLRGRCVDRDRSWRDLGRRLRVRQQPDAPGKQQRHRHADHDPDPFDAHVWLQAMSARQGKPRRALDRSQAAASMRRLSSEPGPLRSANPSSAMSATAPAIPVATGHAPASFTRFTVVVDATDVVPGPACGRARYGNVVWNGTSFASTPSPSVFLLPVRAPSTTRSSISMTSSVSRRPFGKPALSPASTPRRLGVADGGIDMLSRSCSLGFTFAGWLRPFTPVRNTDTRSLRGVAGTGSLYTLLIRCGSSGSVTAPRNWASSFG